MPHRALRVSAVKYPRESLGEIVAGVEQPSEMDHDGLPGLSPALDSEVLNLHMASSGCRLQVIDDVDIRHVVREAATRSFLEETKLRQYTS